MSTNLTGEEFIESIIVGYASDSGNVGGKRYGRQQRSLSFISAHEFRGNVGCVRGTASIAEEQHFASVPEGPGHQLRNLGDAVGMLTRKLLLDGRAFGKQAEYMLLHGKRF